MPYTHRIVGVILGSNKSKAEEGRHLYGMDFPISLN
jgi:hypothetical protein